MASEDIIRAIRTSQAEDRIVRVMVLSMSEVYPYIEDSVDTPDGTECWGWDADGDYRLLVTIAE